MSWPYWFIPALTFGVNFVVWGLIGLGRILDSGFDLLRRFPHVRGSRAHLRWRQSAHVSTRSTVETPLSPSLVQMGDVAVLMAAHNEELVLRESLNRVSELISPSQVHVVSDASSDSTVEIARSCGVNVLETPSNVGKAGALDFGLREFGLLEKFEAVLLLDADTRLDQGYFHNALPLFDDSTVVAVAGYAASDWGRDSSSFVGRTLIAHRSRVYELTQRLIKYGQTWRLLNMTHIVPGFASLYRTAILREIDINPPGLIIEDFNMTFEVYKRGLGQVAFTPGAIAVTQDPDSFADYRRQVRRWSLGLWQTVRRHGLGWDGFSVMLSLLLAELVTASVFLLFLPVLVCFLLVGHAFPVVVGSGLMGDIYTIVVGDVTLLTLAEFVLLPEFTLTALVVLLSGRPAYLLYALCYLPMRIVDASLALSTLAAAARTSSSGRWVSPTRRKMVESE